MPVSKPYRLLAPDFWRLRAAFPVPAAIAIAAAALAIARPSDAGGAFLLFAAAAWPATLAASLHAQARGASAGVSLAAQIAAGLAAAGLMIFQQDLRLALPYFSAGLALLCLAAPVSRLKEPDSYWVWAERFCAAAVFAAAVGFIGWVASTATLYSADHLFHLFGSTLSGRLATDLAVLFFVAVAPIAYLAIQPPIADEALATDEKDFIRRAIAALASWVLAPFVLVYSGMLWLYAAKIVLDRALPDGQIGWMVGAFGFSALSTIILMAPQRRDGPAQTRLLWRIWPYLAIAPLALLGCALYARIDAYGLTEDRYMAGLLGALCAANAVVALVSREAVLRFAPAAGALALILTSFGPWGALATSDRWQRAALLDIYAAHGRIADGLLLLDGGPPAMSKAEARRCNAAAQHLSARSLLKPLVAEKNHEKTGDLSKLCPSVAEQRHNPFHSYHNNSAAWIAPEGEKDLRLLGSFTLSARSRVSEGDIKIDCASDRITVRWRNEAPAVFDMKEIESRFDPKTQTLQVGPLLEPTSGDGRLIFLLQHLYIDISKTDAPALSSLQGFLLRRD